MGLRWNSSDLNVGKLEELLDGLVRHGDLQTDPATGKRAVQVVGADAGAKLMEAVETAAKG